MKKLKNPVAFAGITSKVMLVSTVLLTPTAMMAGNGQMRLESQ